MTHELVIGQDIQVNRTSLNSFGFLLDSPIAPAIYPGNNIHPGSNTYPLQPEYKRILHPGNTFPGFNRFPMRSGYNYIIFKYRLYYCADYGADVTWLNEYYTMNYAYSPRGLLTIKNTIERG